MAVAMNVPEAEIHRLPGIDSTSSLRIEQTCRYGLPARYLCPHPFKPINGSISQSSS